MKILMALLGSSWSLLGRSGPKMGPNMVPKVLQKIVKNLSKNHKNGSPPGCRFGFQIYAQDKSLPQGNYYHGSNYVDFL